MSILKPLADLLPNRLVVSLWKNLPVPVPVRNALLWGASTHFMAGVMGIVFNDTGKLLLVKHTYKNPPWGLPGGALGREQPTDGLRREVMEETGFIIEPVKVLDALWYDKPSQILVVVKARITGGGFKASAEVSDYGFFEPDPGDRPDKLPAMQEEIIAKHAYSV